MKGMKTKKILSIFVVLCMVFTYSGITAFADTEFEGNDDYSTASVDSNEEVSDITCSQGVLGCTIEDGDNKNYWHVHLDKVGIHCGHGGNGNGKIGTYENMIAIYKLDGSNSNLWTIMNGPSCPKCGNTTWISYSNRSALVTSNSNPQFSYGGNEPGPEFGKLEIVKRVEGDEFKEGTFNFVVLNNGNNEYPEEWSGKVTVDEAGADVEVTTLELCPGVYTVKEVDADGKPVDEGSILTISGVDYEVSYSDGAVKVKQGETIVVEITNKLKAINKDIGQLVIKKYVIDENNDPVPGVKALKFKLLRLNGEGYETYGEYDLATDEEEGIGSCIIKNLPYGKYRVEEMTIAGYTVSAVIGEVTTKGALSEDIEIDEENLRGAVDFYNVPTEDDPEPNLTINKNVRHNGALVSGSNQFFFKLYKDNEPYFVNDRNVFSIPTYNGLGEFPITLPAGVYTVEEVMDLNGTPINRDFIYTVSFAIGNGDSIGSHSAGIEIGETGNVTVTFTNATTSRGGGDGGGGGGGDGGGGGRTTTPPINLRDPEVPLGRPEDVPDIEIPGDDVPLVDIPQTGSDNNVAFNFTMLGFSLTALLAMFARRKDITNK